MKNKKKMIKGDFLKIENDIISHKKIENFLTFEIGDEITNDIAEAVCMLMLKIDDDDPIWDKKIENNSLLNISPEKSLFWLSGGHKEWDTLLNYNKPWSEYYLEFGNRFGDEVINSVTNSKKLKDIRDNFTKNLNLTILYDFALSKNMI